MIKNSLRSLNDYLSLFSKNMKIAIIGSGIGGIATAIRLANQGVNVEVFEANAYAGGN